MRVYLQFPAGTAPLVESSVQHALPSARLVYLDDSAAILAGVRNASGLRFAKNVFEVIAETPRRRLPIAVEHLSRILYAARPGANRNPGGGFRVMFHLDGTLIAVDDHLRTSIEKAIANHVHSKVQPRGSCDEYWIVGRRDLDHLLLCRRLTRPDPGRSERGSLSRELCALLITAGEPHSDDVFLDPFGGSGALIRARSASAAKAIVYSDLEPPPGLRRTWNNDARIRVLSEDATELPSIPNGSVTAIVTDPPWGEHQPIDRSHDFTERVCASFQRVLDSQSGRLVVLTSRRTEPIFSNALAQASLPVHRIHQILVNGHPASVLLATPASREAE